MQPGHTGLASTEGANFHNRSGPELLMDISRLERRRMQCVAHRRSKTR
jgi:hypothetical protein